MTNSNTETPTSSPMYLFFEKIENIRHQRVDEIERHPQAYPYRKEGKKVIYKKFNNAEFQEVLGFQWRLAGLAKITSDEVFRLAQHLECNYLLTMELFAIADRFPKVFSDEEMDSPTNLRTRENILKKVAYPAFILDKKWNVLDVNPTILKLLGLPTPKVLTNPRTNLLWLSFSTESLIRKQIEDAGAEEWEMFAIQTMRAFLMEHFLNCQESWYQELLTKLRQDSSLKDFERIYNIVINQSFSYKDILEYRLKFNSNGKLLCVQSTVTRIGWFNYPMIVVLMPDDDVTTELFELIDN